MNRKADKELFKTRAEKCAKEIIDYLLKKEMMDDTFIYVNGKRYSTCDGEGHYNYGTSSWDLKRSNVDDIANKLGLPSVPVVFEGTLDEAKEFVAKHQMSTLNGGLHEMEGIVLAPRDIQLYDNKHKLIKCKCKYRDMLKAGLAE